MESRGYCECGVLGYRSHRDTFEILSRDKKLEIEK